MRKQRGVAVLLLAAVGALAFAGNEPWTSKPYQQWDDKDIAKVLHLSPWSHTVPVEMTWAALSIEDIQAGGDMTGAAGAHAGPGGSGAGSAGGGTGTFMPAEHDGAAYTRGPERDFTVYWSSAKTMREALARRNELHNGGDAKEADAYVNAPQDEYQILWRVPIWLPLTALTKRDTRAWPGCN